MADATWTFDGQVRRFNSIVGRRKKKKDFEYEVQWAGLTSIKFNRWIPRAELVEKGFQKKVNEFDQKKAAAALGSDSRPLTRANVEVRRRGGDGDARAARGAAAALLSAAGRLTNQNAASTPPPNTVLTQTTQSNLPKSTQRQKFLGDFGLDPEFACHSNIRGLSGGQKVKLVLAAAMWNSPHVLVMDE